jgi:hypothetical protein
MPDCCLRQIQLTPTFVKLHTDQTLKFSSCLRNDREQPVHTRQRNERTNSLWIVRPHDLHHATQHAERCPDGNWCSRTDPEICFMSEILRSSRIEYALFAINGPHQVCEQLASSICTTLSRLSRAVLKGLPHTLYSFVSDAGTTLWFQTAYITHTRILTFVIADPSDNIYRIHLAYL